MSDHVSAATGRHHESFATQAVYRPNRNGTGTGRCDRLGSASGGPGLTVNFANVKSDEGAEVSVPYSVSRMPRVARVVLERRDSPTDPFHAVDSKGKARGELVDPDGGGPDCDYRVRIEGARGFVLATLVDSN
jgi:hypothetical protein